MSTEKSDSYDYDLVVIGGGSGGLACCQEAAKLRPDAKIALFNFVAPSSQGKTWGIGGTCINVGCIPKKLMHYAATLRKGMDDALEYGHEFPQPPVFHWEKLVKMVDDVAKGSHFWYENELRDLKIHYINAYAKLVGTHAIEYSTGKTEKKRISARWIVLAYGCRPKLPDESSCPGARKHGLTSDDIFSLKTSPGKTLIVGSSYVALECAGFLNDLGFDVTVMMRGDRLLRGFDQQMSQVLGELLEIGGIRFLNHSTPSSIDAINDSKKKRVTYVRTDQKAKVETEEEFDTVLFAIGREFNAVATGLAEIGVKLSADNQKIIVDESDRTNVANIWAIGDAAHDRPELTSVAIQAGTLLARRLCLNDSRRMNYTIIPTTIFTPVEYAFVGWSEEHARETLPHHKIETYLSRYGWVSLSLRAPLTLGFCFIQERPK